jgi:hypothetical protein
MSGSPTSTERPVGQSIASPSTTQAKKVKAIFREVDRALRALEGMPLARRKQTVKDLLVINEELCDLFIEKLYTNDK